MSDGKLDCATGSDTPWNMIMKSGQSPTKGETRTRSGWISCRPIRLGMTHNKHEYDLLGCQGPSAILGVSIIRRKAKEIIITEAKNPERSELFTKTCIKKKMCKVRNASTDKFIDTVLSSKDR